ncbi:MAG TPA: 2-dehydropantoate 2-reductase [Streptosporangiaceae bacterium]|jgi:2-dehydropantoate 2-reductase|nr:2-dehydropantoate 2-reductase [Streptosporangiaceae bacterium]
MRFLIAGPGAVGGFVAAHLADGGQDVTVLARPHRAGQLRDNGLRLASQDGIRTVRTAVVTADELRSGYDAIVLAVKSSGLDSVMDDIGPAAKPPTVILPFLNGIAHVEALVGRFGSAVLGGVLRVATQVDDDGTIRVLAPTFDVEVGELDRSPSTRVEELASALRDAGANVTVREDIVGAMWAKWVFIVSIGAVTSLMRAPVGDVVAVPGGEEFARAVLAEAAAVAQAAGHLVPHEALQLTERTLTAAGSSVTASLSRDLMAGRPTEVDVLGDFAERARAAGVPAPLIEVSTLALRVHNRRVLASASLERGRRG